MKTPENYSLLLIVLFSILIGCKTNDVSDVEMIKELWKEFEIEYSKGNAQGVANLYALDATRTYKDEIDIGRNEIELAYQKELIDRNENSERIKPEIEVRLIHPEVGIIDGKLEWDSEDGKWITIFTAIVAKREGKWVIVAGRPRGSFLKE